MLLQGTFYLYHFSDVPPKRTKSGENIVTSDSQRGVAYHSTMLACGLTGSGDLTVAQNTICMFKIRRSKQAHLTI